MIQRRDVSCRGDICVCSAGCAEIAYVSRDWNCSGKVGKVSYDMKDYINVRPKADEKPA